MSETYFKTLNRSSKLFLELAKAEKLPKRKCFALSTVINSWVLLEAYTNYLSGILAKAKIEPHEKALLLDKELRLDEDGNFIEARSHTPTLKRVLFILNKFSDIDAKKFKNTPIWAKIQNCEDIRNKLVHPKILLVDDNITVKKAEEFRGTIVSFIKLINKKIIHRPIVLE